MRASEARKNLFPLIEEVNEDRKPVETSPSPGDSARLIHSAHGNTDVSLH
jgi:PHD/YefM family antitoxin component YafN of YafNO toxin-antitoxin module